MAILLSAKCEIELGEFKDAKESLSKAEYIKPDDSSLIQAWISLYRRQKKIDKSLKYYKKLMAHSNEINKNKNISLFINFCETEINDMNTKEADIILTLLMDIVHDVKDREVIQIKNILNIFLQNNILSDSQVNDLYLLRPIEFGVKSDLIEKKEFKELIAREVNLGSLSR